MSRCTHFGVGCLYPCFVDHHQISTTLTQYSILFAIVNTKLYQLCLADLIYVELLLRQPLYPFIRYPTNLNQPEPTNPPQPTSTNPPQLPPRASAVATGPEGGSFTGDVQAEQGASSDAMEIRVPGN